MIHTLEINIPETDDNHTNCGSYDDSDEFSMFKLLS